MKIFISIPVYISNDIQLEFTELTVKSIQSIHEHEIVLINNFCLPELEPRLKQIAKVFDNPKGNNVSAAWNMGIKMGLEGKYDYVLTPNNDLIFHPKCVDNLAKFAHLRTDFVLWTAAQHIDLRTLNLVKLQENLDEHPHFSCFMVSKELVEKLKEKETGTKEPNPGYFDENFAPAYFEDGDMHNRILRAGLKAGITSAALFYHYGSRTIKTDAELDRQNRRTYEENRQYFTRKWGFDPHGRVPENDAPERFKYKGPFEP